MVCPARKKVNKLKKKKVLTPERGHVNRAFQASTQLWGGRERGISIVRGKLGKVEKAIGSAKKGC